MQSVKMAKQDLDGMDKFFDTSASAFEDEFEEASEDMTPTLDNIMATKTLKWIFVGGKGGVGKTTCSCSIAVQLAKVRRNVLILSTDPAHNVSDAFRQKFSNQPMLVNGSSNLYAMEIDATAHWKEAYEDDEQILGEQTGMMGMFKKYTQDLMVSMPGIDEAMSYVQVMRLVQSMDFDVVVFDTAPTGHTLRLLNMPDAIESAMGRIMSLKNTIFPFVSRMGSMFGMGGGAGEAAASLDSVPEKLEQIMPIIRLLRLQFRDPTLTTFICVCIAEFLSVYETERLIQSLHKFEIDCHNIIINQLILCEDNRPCHMCRARKKLQDKYIEQIEMMFDNYHIVKVPLLEDEVHGKESIENFSKMLIRGAGLNSAATTTERASTGRKLSSSGTDAQIGGASVSSSSTAQSR